MNYESFGRAWIDGRPWELLTDLTALDSRMGGSEGERRASDIVAEAFADAGVGELERRSFEMNRWVRGSSSLTSLSPHEREFEALALPYSPAGSVEGELIDAGYGTPAEIDAADVEGAVAVASTTTPSDSRFVHRMEKFGYAIESGAVGFVFVNHVEGQLPPTGALRFDEEADAVAVGVSKETGAWLTDYADRGGRVRIDVEAETRPGTSQNVVGRLGPDTGEELLLLAHYDAHDVAEGALDNGCGVAAVSAAAAVLADCDLPIGVRVAAVGCEEIGLMGSEHLADTLDRDRIRAVINADGAGRYRDLVAMTHASDGTRAAAEAVVEATGHPIRIDPDPHPFSDQWPFVRRGVPALQLHSDSGERGRGWGHTHADTRDKVDERNLREHGMLTALLVEELAAADPARLDEDELIAAFRDADFETGMRAAGMWPERWA